jgi:hypothetical protein
MAKKKNGSVIEKAVIKQTERITFQLLSAGAHIKSAHFIFSLALRERAG